MRKIVILAGIAVIAAIAIAWTRSSYDRSVPEIRPLPNNAIMSPFDLMLQNGRNLPAEDWTDKYRP